ncbi:MAG: hypothetical protein IJ410_02720, partial [Oscillospiraceae bacterium]|nr:hypothetical protein [Oscillospiraceae bacterium]
PSHSDFPGAASLPFGFLAFPVLSDLVSHVFFPGSLYSAFCLFPFILPGFAPTAVPPVLPFCSRFRAFPSLPLPFVRFCSVLTTQPSVFLFPSSRFPLSAVPSVLPLCLSASLLFLFRPACFHALLPIVVLCFLLFLSPSLSRLTVATSAPQPSLAGFGLIPFAYRFRFWLLGFRFLPFGFFLCCPLRDSLIIITHLFVIVNNFFQSFL